MLKPSPELLAISRRWYKAVLQGNGQAVQDLLSAREELRFVGTGHEEYWQGRVVRDGVADYFRELPEDNRYEELQAEAFELGSAGWSCFSLRINFRGEETAHIIRTTLIFLLEGASWKVIQRHSSFPTENTAIIGVEQSAIRLLIEAANDGGLRIESKEGLASVIFTDIVGSTALAAALGDQRWSRLVTNHFDQLERIVSAHDGQMVKSLGDGSLSIFSSARQALKAAGEMQAMVAAREEEPQFGLRVGLHTGDVVQTQDDFFGNVVNLAARITSVADAGDVLVSGATRAMLAGTQEFEFTPVGARQFKGVGGETPVFALNWKLGPETTKPPGGAA